MPNHFLEVFLDFLMFSYNFLESVRGHLAIVAKFVVVMYLYGTWVSTYYMCAAVHMDRCGYER